MATEDNAGEGTASPQHAQREPASHTAGEPPLDHHREELIAALAKLSKLGRLTGEVDPELRGVGEADA